MATTKPNWTEEDQKELQDMKLHFRQIKMALRCEFEATEISIHALKEKQLNFLKSLKVKTILEKVSDEMNAQSNLAEAFDDRMEHLHQSELLEKDEVHELHTKFNYEKQWDQIYSSKLNDLEKKKPSIDKLYNHILYCRYTIVPEELTNDELTEVDAIKLFNYAHMLGYILAQLLDKSDISLIPSHIENDYVRETIRRLYNRCKSQLGICTILYTVLTIKTLSDEDKEKFRKALKDVKMSRTNDEDEYIYRRFCSDIQLVSADCADEHKRSLIEQYEKLFIHTKAVAIINFLHAVTALHYKRKTRHPILENVIESFHIHYRRGLLPDIDKAIEILRQQDIDKSEFRSISPLSSLGLISNILPNIELGEKRWYGYQKYLYIKNSRLVDFPIYIHRSEINVLLELITEQFKFDHRGLYEEEKCKGLLNESIRSLIVYLAENIKENRLQVSVELECGGEKMKIQDNLYITDKSYGELEKTTFKHLDTHTEKYTKWFRYIINGKLNEILYQDATERDICILALAKIISESSRNITTWMINLMCLDLIEKKISLQENCEGTAAKPTMMLETSPWNLFFKYHSMAGGSYNKSRKNENEIKDKELHIVMNWLCNSWPGEETVSMTDRIDDSYYEKSRIDIEYGDRHYRSIISDMLYYRMNLNVRWDAYYDPDDHTSATRIQDGSRGRRILGRIYFDNEQLVDDTDSERLNTPSSRLNFLISADKNGINNLSIERFEKLIDRNKKQLLNEFYNHKIDELKQRKSEETDKMYSDNA